MPILGVVLPLTFWQWVQSVLQGEPGPVGPEGPPGEQGPQGEPGANASVSPYSESTSTTIAPSATKEIDVVATNPSVDMVLSGGYEIDVSDFRIDRSTPVGLGSSEYDNAWSFQITNLSGTTANVTVRGLFLPG